MGGRQEYIRTSGLKKLESSHLPSDKSISRKQFMSFQRTALDFLEATESM